MDFRAVLVPALTLVLLVGATATASAQGGWCARMIGGGENCGFATFGQCQAALSGNGGVCAPNPRARNNGPSQNEETFRRAKAEEAARRAEQARAQQRQLEQERRHAPPAAMQKTAPAVVARPTPAPTPTTQSAAMPVGGIPITDLDTNEIPTLNREGIRQVQVALKGKGFDPGPIDGTANPRFQAAMQTFQTTYGIKVRGVIDNQTLLALGQADLTGQPNR